eukprot:5418576-Amphidinium_carterae.1
MLWGIVASECTICMLCMSGVTASRSPEHPIHSGHLNARYVVGVPLSRLPSETQCCRASTQFSNVVRTPSGPYEFMLNAHWAAHRILAKALGQFDHFDRKPRGICSV